MGPAETHVERESWSAWQRRGNHFFGLVGTTLPGLVLAFLIAMSGWLLAELPTAAFFVTPVGAAIGLPPRLATLIAVGTGICGNSAIVAMAPVIEATDDEVSHAVGCITIFELTAGISGRVSVIAEQ